MLGPAYRSVCSLKPVRHRIAPWVRGHDEIDAFSPDGRGLGPEVTLAAADRRSSLEGTTAVLLGAGAGHEADMLAAHGVRHVIGADIEAHAQKWHAKRATLARQGVESTFLLMDGGSLALKSKSVDLVFSQSVLEHVMDLDATLAEARRILKPGGRFVAWYGPLWPTFGGPHVAELAYDHLLVDETSLIAKARAVGDGWEYWLELGLFNELRYDDYLELMGRHFDIDWVGVAGSREGAHYRDQYPEVWSQLCAAHSEFDLLTRLVGVVARPLG